MQNKNNLQKHTFHIHGMHCNACVLTIESKLGDLENIESVKPNLRLNSVEVWGDFGGKTLDEIAEELTLSLKPHNYIVSVEKKIKNKNWKDFKIAIPITLIFVFIFIFLQKIGLINLVGGGKTTYGTSFVIGIIASLSTCMAVVGGLLLSMSATFAKSNNKIIPQSMFHVGRLISFFVLGGVIGSLGGVFTLNENGTFVLSLLVGLVMFVLGINLLDIFTWSKKLQPSMPKFIGRYAHSISKLNHTLTPFLVGVATFFLPCGFTQSMQLYTLATGSFLKGGLTMLFFALGTLPVLTLISFSSFSIQKSSKAGVFFKTAGLVVILFAIFNIINSLASVGLISPLFNF